MAEKTFTLKEGMEVPTWLNGVQIQYVIADSPEHALQLAGSPENFTAIFNEAYALRLQKDVKMLTAEWMEESPEQPADLDDRVRQARERAATYKPGEIRARGAGTGKTAQIRAEAEQKAIVKKNTDLINGYLSAPAEQREFLRTFLANQGITDEMIAEAEKARNQNVATVNVAAKAAETTTKRANGGPKPGRESR